jgi:hypothetical protein
MKTHKFPNENNLKGFKMRKIILLFFIGINISLYCQDVEPSAMNFTYNNQFGKLGDFVSLKQDRFVIGPQWGCPPRLLKALLCTANQNNFYVNFFPEAVPVINDKLLAIPTPINNFPQFVQSFQFEPTLQTDYFGHLKIRYPSNPDDDPEGSIFGFNYIWDKAITWIEGTGQDKKFRLYLPANEVPTNSRIKILGEHPMQNQLCNLTSIDDIKKSDGKPETPEEKLNGENWYISVNLRVHDDTKNMTGNPNDKILGIVIKTMTGTASGKIPNQNIRFHKLPNPDYVNEYLCTDGSRGWTYDDGPELNPEIVDEFVITRNMLPYNDKTALGANLPPKQVNGNVTISALFRCINDNGKFEDDKNPELKIGLETKGGVVKNGKITDLMIEVYYYGNEDIDIDWIRISTPQGRDLFWGKHDGPGVDGVNYFIKPDRKQNDPPLDPFNQDAVALWGVDNIIGSFSIADAVQFFLTWFDNTHNDTYKFFRFSANSGDDGICYFTPRQDFCPDGKLSST